MANHNVNQSSQQRQLSGIANQQKASKYPKQQRGVNKDSWWVR
jgi:hypothetical protein